MGDETNKSTQIPGLELRPTTNGSSGMKETTKIFTDNSLSSFSDPKPTQHLLKKTVRLLKSVLTKEPYQALFRLAVKFQEIHV